MFESATVKLTAWYLAIIIAISLLFSVVIYSIASSEVGSRITYLQRSNGEGIIIDERLREMRRDQIQAAEVNLVTALAITNICIWLAGGVGSYYLARRTLYPIEKAHDAQSRFTSDASHELRTPLASMRTELEVALNDPKLSKIEMKELLESNLEEVEKLTQLSHMLLQLSRLDHTRIERRKVDLLEEITKTTERLNRTNERIALKSSKVPPIYANRASVGELVTILADNALKYSPRESTVVVRMLKQRQMAGFEVENEGDGIPPEALEHIFDRFYRADASRSSSSHTKGYGLGLSLAKRLVEIHNGELTVSSRPDGPTIFRVMFPTNSPMVNTPFRS